MSGHVVIILDVEVEIRGNQTRSLTSVLLEKF